ncbi:MAG: HlyD family efflux transporter periplasmic adaptor subunit [Nitrospirales bacterium]|nr:HlyD family efflux transporter periplasmic adaptor subunit [Nitrospirales bacterium]
MTKFWVVARTVRLGFSTALISVCLLMSCSRPDSNQVQGYVEGEFVYVASPLPGALHALHVQRGMQIKAGDLLFTLDHTPEQAARDEAERRLAQAQANSEDVKKGKRPSEIAAIEAQLNQARAALTLAEKEFARQENLSRTPGATAELETLRARSARDQARQRVTQLEADLKTAQLGSRSDQIASAEANLRAVEAALTKAEWDLSQKGQTAPQAGLVFDTLYREGEWVPAGRPVVALLPPRNIKVRAFVSETRIGLIHPGDRVTVGVDGVPERFFGTVSYISPQAEYTPPVIYSKESRSKLVFMIEAVFDPVSSAKLHPGQPVDVHFNF